MVKAFFSPMTLAVMGLFMMTAVVVDASEQGSNQMEKAGEKITMPKPSDIQSEPVNKKESNTTIKKEYRSTHPAKWELKS